MLQKIYKHIDKHTLKPQELILIECIPKSAKSNVILNAETFDRMIQCMPDGSKKAQYILNKNLLWKETEVLDSNMLTNGDVDTMNISEMTLVYMSLDDTITEVVCTFDENSIALDTKDISCVLNHKGISLMHRGYATGTQAAYDATKIAIKSTELQSSHSVVDDAMGILIIFETHPDYPLHGIADAMDILYSRANKEADVMFCTQCNDDMKEDEVRVIVVATGL